MIQQKQIRQSSITQDKNFAGTFKESLQDRIRVKSQLSRGTVSSENSQIESRSRAVSETFMVIASDIIGRPRADSYPKTSAQRQDTLEFRKEQFVSFA